MVDSIYNFTLSDVYIDRTYFLAVDPDKGIYRATRRRKTENRFENMSIKYHKKVLNNFEQIYESNKDRILRIDSSQKIKDIALIIAEDFDKVKAKKMNKSIAMK